MCKWFNHNSHTKHNLPCVRHEHATSTRHEHDKNTPHAHVTNTTWTRHTHTTRTHQTHTARTRPEHATRTRHAHDPTTPHAHCTSTARTQHKKPKTQRNTQHAQINKISKCDRNICYVMIPQQNKGRRYNNLFFHYHFVTKDCDDNNNGVSVWIKLVILNKIYINFIQI